jgi:hypothetical protein
MDLFCVKCLEETRDPEAVRQASYLVGGSSLCTEHAARAIGVKLGGEPEGTVSES